MKKVALILLLTLPCVAQTPAKYSTRVKLLVSGGNDESLRNQVNSFLGRELRSLGDVAIVNDQPDFVIAVLVNKPIEGGSVVSVARLVSSPLNADLLTALFGSGEKGGDSQFQSLKRYITHGSQILDFSLQTGNVSDVQNICKQMIVEFDTRQLDPERQLWNQNVKPR
jgi:hypothetical protein